MNEIFKNLKGDPEYKILFSELTKIGSEKFLYKPFDAPETFTIDSISVIQCFYGLNIDRIQATYRALAIMLRSNPLPKKWIFIEAQSNYKNRVFSWLETLIGVTYIFVKLPEGSINIQIKGSLWNIGAFIAQTEKICFIDSDVAFQSQSWLKNVSDELNDFEVISTHKFSYNLNSGADSLNWSFGRSLLMSGSVQHCHAGFGVAMQTEFFKNYFKYFKPALFLDDYQMLSRIIGYKKSLEIIDWIDINSCLTDQEYKEGYPIKIGCADNIAVHFPHNGFKNIFPLNYKELRKLCQTFAYCIPDGIKYDSIFSYKKFTKNNLVSIIDKYKNSSQEQFGKLLSKFIPVWSDYVQEYKDENISKWFKAFRAALCDFMGQVDFKNLELWNNYDGGQAAKDKLKKFGIEKYKDKTIFVCTVIRGCFSITADYIFCQFRDILVDLLQNDNFYLIIFSDIEPKISVEALDDMKIIYIPLDKNIKDSDQINRKDIEYPTCSKIFYIPFQDQLENCIEFQFLKNNLNVVKK